MALHFSYPLNHPILPPTPLPLFNCDAVLEPIKEHNLPPGTKYLAPGLFKHRHPALQYVNDIQGPMQLQNRIDNIVEKLERQQADFPNRCIRGFADYVVNRSLPAKLCQVVQKLDLAWIRHALTYFGNRKLAEDRENCGLVCEIFDRTDYRGRAKYANDERVNVVSCELRVRELTGEKNLFLRYHQENPPFRNSTMVAPNKIPIYEQYYYNPPSLDPALVYPGAAGMNLYA